MDPEIKALIEAQGRAWEEFKSTNDQRLKEIESKGKADPLTEEKMGKINEAMSALQAKQAELETAIAREFKGGELPEQKGTTAEVKEYKQAFSAYLRKGQDSNLEELQRKALSVNSDPNGGYLVTPQMSSVILSTIKESSPMRALASVQTIGTDSLDYMVDDGDFSSSWTGETSTRNDTDNSTLGKKTIETHELFAQPKATQRLIDDSAINIEQWIAEKVADKFARVEATAFITGNGTNKPKGILAYANGTGLDKIEQINAGDASLITSDGLIKLFYALKDEYARNATFLMNRLTVQAVRLLKETTTGNYLWMPGLAAGAPDTILGRPVQQAADMPTVASNALAVAFGDFRRGYTIVDRDGIRTLRDPFTSKPFVKFYTTKRVGGEVVNGEAIKLLKIAA